MEYGDRQMLPYIQRPYCRDSLRNIQRVNKLKTTFEIRQPSLIYFLSTFLAGRLDPSTITPSHSPSTLLATGSMDTMAKVWNVETGAELATLQVGDRV